MSCIATAFALTQSTTCCKMGGREMGNWQNQLHQIANKSKSALSGLAWCMQLAGAVPFLGGRGFFFLNSQQKNIARAGKQKLNSQPFIWSPAWKMTAEKSQVRPVPEALAVEGTRMLHFPTSPTPGKILEPLFFPSQHHNFQASILSRTWRARQCLLLGGLFDS